LTVPAPRRCVLPLALAVLATGGCGGGGHGNAATTTATAPSTPAAERAAVGDAWQRFFAGSTQAPAKVALLQNGAAFAKAIEAQAKSPLAKQSSAKVTRVVLVSAKRATVFYTIDLSGKPALPNQRGVAVKDGGRWKVAQSSFCALLKLQGAPPAACS
jgi:hypothetical protein